MKGEREGCGKERNRSYCLWIELGGRYCDCLFGFCNAVDAVRCCVILLGSVYIAIHLKGVALDVTSTCLYSPATPHVLKGEYSLGICSPYLPPTGWIVQAVAS